MWTLYEGDCLEIMPTLPDKSIDIVLTDPPFFCPATHYQSRVGWERKWGDMSILEHWWGLMCDTIRPKLKDSAHFLTFCNADSYPAFYIPMYSRWEKLVSLVWDKDRPGLGRVFRHQHELVIAARNSGAWEPNDGKLRADVLRFKATLSRDRLHPVEKPPEMLRYLIEAVCPPDGIVLDCFAGSGTTAIAAEQCGRNSILIEREPKYCEIIRKRMADYESARQGCLSF